MDASARIEAVLNQALARSAGPECPPRLAEAMRYAVFPGGGRMRPKLCIAIAWACGDDEPAVSNSAAAAIELLHCASLVHDDMPCFDDAETRRGKPAVHRAFGENLALLVGDALIVLAFETIAHSAARRPHRMGELLRIVARAVGAPAGIVAGQAWEAEREIDLAHYHRAKTGSLFAGATEAGAAAAGAHASDWVLLGELLGEAYQVADDIRDAYATEAELGKPVGRDAALGRPSAAASLGLDGAIERLSRLVDGAVAAVPDGRRAREIKAMIRQEAASFLPAGLAHRAL
jgi:geranylgeranyl diphosphate synthase type II